MIFDTDNNPIQSFPFSIDAGEEKTFTVRIECRSGSYLRSETVSDLTVEARKVGDSDWIDLEASEIDLAPFDGTRQNFEIRMTAAAVSSAQTRNFKLTVGP